MTTAEDWTQLRRPEILDLLPNPDVRRVPPTLTRNCLQDRHVDEGARGRGGEKTDSHEF